MEVLHLYLHFICLIRSTLISSSKDIHDLTLYKHMVGFVMSYSFTDHESNETLMVPVADIFNHHTNNNAQLSFDDESHLRMISTKPIKKVKHPFFRIISSNKSTSFEVISSLFTFCQSYL